MDIPTTTPSIPLPTDVACSPTSVPTLQNWDGLFGQVCQVNIAPGVGDISACCEEGAEVRVQDGCTQYCKVTSSPDEFSACIAGFFVSLDSGFETFCQDVNDGIGAPGPDSTSVLTATATIEVPGATSEATDVLTTTATSETPSSEPSEGASSTPVESGSETPDGTSSETAPPPAATTGAASKLSVTAGIATTFLAIGAAYFLY